MMKNLDDRMRILHISPYYAPAYAFGGVVRALQGLAEAQVAAGHRVTILTSAVASRRLNLRAGEEQVNGVDVVRIPNRWLALRRAANLSSPRGWLEQARPLLATAEIIHCHEFRTIENLHLKRGLRELRVSVPLLLSPHGTLTHDTGRRAAKTLWDFTLGPGQARLFDQVICLSAAERAEVGERWRSMGLPMPPTAVVPNAVAADLFTGYDRQRLRSSFRERYGLGSAPTMLFLGRLQRRKGAFLLARAFVRAFPPSERQSVQLIFVGPDEGERASLLRLRDERIHLLGYLQGEARLAALAAADGFALPAVGEGQPMALLEALAVGLPVIITSGCQLPQAAADNAGWLVEPEIGSIAAALERWLAARKEWAEMAAAGRRLAREEFSWLRVEAALTTVYRDLMARMSSTARS